MKPTEVILAIDPGTLLMGFAVIAIRNNHPVLVTMDVLKLRAIKIYTCGSTHSQQSFGTDCAHQPTTFAIEAPFFGKNVQSMLKLGRAQGVAIAAAMQAGIDVTEYSPRKVKQSVTGNGNAGKEQVWKMLQQILKIETQPTFYDATDALAVALCHYYQTRRHWQQAPKTLKAGKNL